MKRSVADVRRDIDTIKAKRLALALQNGNDFAGLQTKLTFKNNSDFNYLVELNMAEARLKLELHLLESARQTDQAFYLFFLIVSSYMIWILIKA